MSLLPYQRTMSHTLTLWDVHAALFPGYIDTATVTATRTDVLTGLAIAGQGWPLSLAYVAGSNGTYRVTLLPDLTLTVGQRVRVAVLADAGSEVERIWYLDLLIMD